MDMDKETERVRAVKADKSNPAKNATQKTADEAAAAKKVSKVRREHGKLPPWEKADAADHLSEKYHKARFKSASLHSQASQQLFLIDTSVWDNLRNSLIQKHRNNYESSTIPSLTKAS